MILRLFSGDRFINAILIGLFTVGLWIPSFLSNGSFFFEPGAHDMPFYALLDGLFEKHILLSKIVALLFLLLQGIMIIRINARYVLIQERTFLPAFFFLVISSFFPFLLNFSFFLFGSFFILVMLEIIFSVYKAEPNSFRFFESGLLIGIASLFYAKLIFLLPFLWVVALILRPFYWREWVLPILGLLIPYLMVFSILYLSDKDSMSLFVNLFDNLFLHSYSFRLNWTNMVFSGFLLILILIASIYMLKVFQFRKIYIRNYYLSFFWLFVLGLLVFVILSGFEIGMIYILAIPVSFIFSNFFINSRALRGKNVLFLVFLLMALGRLAF
jgi:hypothetical protein